VTALARLISQPSFNQYHEMFSIRWKSCFHSCSLATKLSGRVAGIVTAGDGGLFRHATKMTDTSQGRDYPGNVRER
jgi:hypothetical protein